MGEELKLGITVLQIQLVVKAEIELGTSDSKSRRDHSDTLPPTGSMQGREVRRDQEGKARKQNRQTDCISYHDPIHKAPFLSEYL